MAAASDINAQVQALLERVNEENPADPAGFLIRNLQSLAAKPTVTKVSLVTTDWESACPLWCWMRVPSGYFRFAVLRNFGFWRGPGGGREWVEVVEGCLYIIAC